MIKVNLLEQVDWAITKEPKAKVGVLGVVLSLILILLLGAAGSVGYAIYTGEDSFLSSLFPKEAISVVSKSVSKTPSNKKVNKKAESKEKKNYDVASEVIKSLKSKNKINATYFNLSPSERISFQKSSFQSLFSYFIKITPLDVAFVNLSFEIPGHYYLHGMAETSRAYESFSSVLKNGSSKFEEKPLNTIGNSSNVEFVVYGDLNFIENKKKVGDVLLSPDAVKSEISKLNALAEKVNCKLGSFSSFKVTKHGLYEKTRYRVKTDASFSLLSNLMTSLNKSSIKIGMQNVSMKAAKVGDISSVIDFVIYTKK